MKQMQTDGRALLLLPCAQKRLNGFQFLELVVAYRKNLHFVLPAPKRRDAVLYSKRKELDT